jgi:2-polyprenyl-6-methoxyphenol hydroxylase-like FAD-dependent oxidoreductase
MRISNCDVLIQGAGIGGLTLALALQQKGYVVELVERSSGLTEVGAGIWMAPNAMQVFSRLGFADKIAAAGWPIKLLRLQDSRAGDLQVTDISQISQEFGFETIALHRGILQRLLFEQLRPCPVRFNSEIRSLDPGTDHVRATLSDGTSITAGIVVGADGFHSRIRQMTGLGGDKRYSGSSSYRAIARQAGILPPEAGHEAYEIWARGCRVGFSKINPDDYYWYMTFEAPAGEVSSTDAMRRHAEILFQSHFPRWIGLLEKTQPEEILRTDISDLRPLATWSSGRTGLIGDAAHATTPNLGQGAAMAIEDAFVLANFFAQVGLGEAVWKKFEQLRREKVDFTVATSWKIGKVCHTGNWFLRLARNLAFKSTPESVSRKQIQRMYRI